MRITADLMATVVRSSETGTGELLQGSTIKSGRATPLDEGKNDSGGVLLREAEELATRRGGASAGFYSGAAVYADESFARE